MNTKHDLPIAKKDHTPLTPCSLISRARKMAGSALLIALMLTRLEGHAQKNCVDCNISSFGAVTLYHVVQSGSVLGFGLEAGKWNKEESRFSYFLGTKMQWFRPTEASKLGNSADDLRFSVYVKGQFEILNRLYIVASPQFVNLCSFETGLGLRYSYPLSSSIGVGIEPTYSIIGRQYSLNTNIHFALP